jgi:hypothetical protein
MERISGPFLGYYLAAYAIASDEGYLGFAKICPDKPQDVWTCSAFDKVGIGPRARHEDALGDAEAKARLFLRLLHEYHLE